MKEASANRDPFKKPAGRSSRAGSGSGSVRGRRASSRAGAGVKKWGGKPSGGSAKSKKRTSSARSSKTSAMAGFGDDARREGGSSRGKGRGGGGGIGLMPT